MKDLGERHFLSSQARFTACKQALQKKHLLNLAVNLTDRPSLEHFAKILKQGNAEITFSNLTNVWEHAGDSLESSLPVLPFNPGAIIMHSSRAYTGRGNLKMMGISKGLSAYVDAAKPASSFWRNYGKYPGNR